jgi:hypothetical protein
LESSDRVYCGLPLVWHRMVAPTALGTSVAIGQVV